MPYDPVPDDGTVKVASEGRVPGVIGVHGGPAEEEDAAHQHVVRGAADLVVGRNNGKRRTEGRKAEGSEGEKDATRARRS